MGPLRGIFIMDGRRLRVGSPKEIVFFLATPLNMPWAFYQFWLALNHACIQSVTGVISHWYSHKCNHWGLYSRTAWYPSSNLTAVPMNTGFSTGITFWGKVYADIHLPYQTTPKTLIRPNSTWFWTPTKCLHRHVFFWLTTQSTCLKKRSSQQRLCSHCYTID